MQRAVAVDLGATSGRIAIGTLEDGRISFEVVEQILHEPLERNGRLEWDFEKILGLCRSAVQAAANARAATVGIDSWGVDNGFLDSDGRLIGSPVCYRDLSHLAAFEELASVRQRLYELTGTQHQPFNTICQLVARRREDPTLPKRCEWLILPDLVGFLLGGERNHEITQASTTQLLGLDGRWSEEAFRIAGWPTPERQPSRPGKLGGKVAAGVSIAHVGSHDTASAVAGFGPIRDDQVFLNVGTWSLAGCVLDKPVATPQAEAGNFTNELMVDGRVRFLRNIPGFYFINRLHKDLGVAASVPEWLSAAERCDERVDLLHPDLFNPDSMLAAARALCSRVPKTDAEWAGLALGSLAAIVSATVPKMETIVGRRFSSFRIGGGGSQSAAFCQALANESSLSVIAGPAEATVLGNLAAQFVAQGVLADWPEAYEVVERSLTTTEFLPS
ncbi:MAG TPA: FGGY-family carbohydrate kinase [Fimbriimonas sp.]|nr:FGGY-family carbohydrate kinase [Fimbriimonas sp.]